MRTIARGVFVAAALAAAAGAPGPLRGTSGVARADDGWKAEFEDICARTQDAMTLGDDELRALIARCDKLKPAVEKAGGPEGKVYTRRLQQCRDLYQFVLDSRAAGTQG